PRRTPGMRCAARRGGRSASRGSPATRYDALCRSSAQPGPPHPFQLAAKTLARPALPTDRLDARRDLPDDGRWAVVDVARGGAQCADARFDRPYDLDDPLTFGDQGMDDIAGTNLRRGLGRVAVDAVVPALAQL